MIEQEAILNASSTDIGPYKHHPTNLIPSKPTPLVHSDARRSRALVTLGSNDLVVVVTQLHTLLGPSIEMVSSSDSTTNTLLRPDRPVLRESLGAVDGRLVDAGAGVDVVSAAVGVDGALELQVAAGVVGSVGVEDVVLDQRVAGPAVHAEVCITLGREGAAVLDRSGSMSDECLVIEHHEETYLALPGFQPLPDTKFPVFCQLTLYFPAPSLL